MKPFFISTAIPYVNAPGHIGHALEFVQADVVARYQRSLGHKVFFLTGTDENSLKNVKATEQQGVSTKELVDRNANTFQSLAEELNISYDDFIRTTETRHTKGAQKLWLACKEDIYQKTYRGLYCIGCEEFYQQDELEDGKCPEHRVEPDVVEEENYFFRLSKYQNHLGKLFREDAIKVIPNTRKNEIVSFIDSGLQDICISRSVERAKGWGISVPEDASQIIWVWFDALSNYINALGYGEDGEKFEEFWHKSNQKVHVIGKGIARFHAIYWPAILLSAKISLPSTIFVHGYVTVDGQKMSKTLGNVVDPFELVAKYGTDAVRYFLLREIPATEDGDFSYEKFETRYNADLANGLGNQVKRILTTAAKNEVTIESPNRETVIQEWSRRGLWEYLEKFEFNKALELIWQGIPRVDSEDNSVVDSSVVVGLSGLSSSIEANRPFDPRVPEDKRKRDDSNHLMELWRIAIALEPFLPETSKKITQQLQEGRREILFPRTT